MERVRGHRPHGNIRALVRALVGLALLAIVTGCAPTSDTVPCPDDSVCAAGLRCARAANPDDGYLCVSPGDLAACEGLKEADTCTSAAGPGTCTGGRCAPYACGNLREEGDEACDDGNLVSGDGCSADCRSAEVCGNNVVDGRLGELRGEECDEGVPGLSGDGCTSRCSTEYRLWRDVTPQPPTARAAPVMAADVDGDGVLLFGGGTQGLLGDILDNVSFSSLFDDLWRWDGAQWSAIDAIVRPPARAAAASARAPGGGGRLLVFGGVGKRIGQPGDLFLGDLWEWSGAAWREIVPPPGPRPSARAYAAFACRPGSCILFGGVTNTGRSNEAWRWDGASWSLLPSSGARPSARVGAALVYDPVRAVLLLTGGRAALNEAADDTWELDASDAWRRVATSAPAIQTASLSGFYADDAVHVIAPGSAITLHTFEPVARRWDPVATASPPTTETVAAARATSGIVIAAPTASLDFTYELEGGAWRMAASQRIELFVTGEVAAAFVPELAITAMQTPGGTFAWTSRGVRRLAPATLPAEAGPPTWSTALAYDQRCQRLVAFGGFAGRSTPAGTWLLEPTGWRPLAPPDSLAVPDHRIAAAMVYDEVRERVLLFGGMGDAPLADFWHLDTTSCATPVWRQLAGGPPPRAEATFTFDARRGVAVLFGGTAAGTPARKLGDVWEWDGVSWAQRWDGEAPGGPTPRARHGAAYDPILQRVVIVGAVERDTWLWDGASWTRDLPIVALPQAPTIVVARDVQGLLAVQPSLSRVTPITRPGAVFRLTSEQITDPGETCRGDEDSDGDGRRGCADPDCWYRCSPLCPPVPGAPACTASPRCGNGMCEVIENHLLCPADCPAPT